MRISAIAVPYAKALFDLALERNELDTVMNDMSAVASVCSAGKDFVLMLRSPIININKKLKIVRETFTGSVSQLTISFLDIIVKKRREKFLPDIAESFTELYKDHKGILTVTVKTATPVTDAIRKEIIDVMKKHTDKTIDLEEVIQEDLIGGFVLNWKDKQYDASILDKINKLKKGVARINLFVKKL